MTGWIVFLLVVLIMVLLSLGLTLNRILEQLQHIHARLYVVGDNSPVLHTLSRVEDHAAAISNTLLRNSPRAY